MSLAAPTPPPRDTGLTGLNHRGISRGLHGLTAMQRADGPADSKHFDQGVARGFGGDPVQLSVVQIGRHSSAPAARPGAAVRKGHIKLWPHRVRPEIPEDHLIFTEPSRVEVMLNCAQGLMTSICEQLVYHNPRVPRGPQHGPPHPKLPQGAPRGPRSRSAMRGCAAIRCRYLSQKEKS
jgi:hypothetical protein